MLKGPLGSTREGAPGGGRKGTSGGRRKGALGGALGTALKGALRDTLGRAGLEVRANRYGDPYALLAARVDAARPLVVDVGAFTGETYARFRARLPAADIHLVEPFPASAETLRRRSANDARCHVHEIALSSAAGAATLRANELPATSSLKPLAAGAAATWEAARLRHASDVPVRTTTLDALCREADIERVDVLKIDVQGAEHEVLLGAAELLGDLRVGLILFEHIFAETYAGQRPLVDYLTLLGGHGYVLLDILEPLRRRGRLLQCDFLFADPRIADPRAAAPRIAHPRTPAS